MAYETTSVPIERSQGEIRKLLVGFGATEFQFGEGVAVDGRRWSGVSFRHESQTVMIQVPLKTPDPDAIAATAKRARTRTHAEIENAAYEQEQRRIWRVLFWSIKARMVAVEENVETFEQAFLAHLVDPRTGITLWQYVQPAIESGAFRLGGEGLRALEARSPSKAEVDS